MRALLRYFKPTMPPVALLMESDAAFALRVGASESDPTPLVQYEEHYEHLEESALPGPDSLEALASSMLTRLGSPKKIGIVLGDTFFKTQVLTLSDFPRSEQEREKVILWHIRKFLNYPIDSVRMAYEVVGRTSNGATLFVTLCPATEIKALESAFSSKGCQVGYIGSSTVEIFNLALAKGLLPSDGNALIINRTPDYLSLLFVAKNVPLFFRCKDIDGREEEDDQVNDRLIQELRLTMAYYKEKLGGDSLRSVIIRRFPGGAFLPLEDIIDEDVPVQDMQQSLPPLPSGAARHPEYLPLFGLLEGGS